MKTLKQLLKPSSHVTLFMIFLLGCAYGNSQIINGEPVNSNKPETQLPPEILWDVKAYHPEAKLLKIKAIDKEGNFYDVKAIQSFDDISILDVKAIVNNEYLPVKLIVKENEAYYPLKAITSDGILLDIKAITNTGELLPVKGIGTSGIIIRIRAIGDNDTFYNVFAISPDGHVNDVKGLKMLKTNVETVINEISIYAHVKALRQN